MGKGPLCPRRARRDSPCAGGTAQAGGVREGEQARAGWGVVFSRSWAGEADDGFLW